MASTPDTPTKCQSSNSSPASTYLGLVDADPNHCTAYVQHPRSACLPAGSPRCSSSAPIPSLVHLLAALQRRTTTRGGGSEDDQPVSIGHHPHSTIHFTLSLLTASGQVLMSTLLTPSRPPSRVILMSPTGHYSGGALMSTLELFHLMPILNLMSTLSQQHR